MSKTKNKIQKKLTNEIALNEKKELLKYQNEMEKKAIKLPFPIKFFAAQPCKTEFGREVKFPSNGDYEDYFKRKIVDVIDFSVQRKGGLFVTFYINPNATREKILFLIEKWLSPHLMKRSVKRFRTEALRDLEVYRLRAIGKVIQFPIYRGREKKPEEYRQTVKKKSFVEIGAELGMNKDAARKAYNRAYELIYGMPYRKGVEAKVQKALLKKECNTCKDRPSCKELCSDVLAYAAQDKGKASFLHWR